MPNYNLITKYLNEEIDILKDKMHEYIDNNYDTKNLQYVKKYLESMLERNEKKKMENDFCSSVEDDTEDEEYTEE